jgi:Arc/MetJ family transcription regulator
MAIRKTALMVDDELVAQAKAILGTKTTTETVREALLEVMRVQARVRSLEWLRRRGSDLLDPEVMSGAWGKGERRMGTWGDGCVDTSG